MADNIDSRLKKLVAGYTEKTAEEIKDIHSFVDDFGLDSLDQVELVMEIEEEFGIEIPDDAMESMQTVGDAKKFVERHAV